MNPAISLCHTTARLPDGWREAAKAWLERADHPEHIEYVLSVDEGTDVGPLLRDFPEFGKIRVVVNDGRPNCIDGWNRAAQASSAPFLITVADDLFPPEHWDTEIFKLVPNPLKPIALDINHSGERGLIPFVFATRALLHVLCEKYGYAGFFYPEYSGVYADTEFTAIVRREQLVLDAWHIEFDHRHPILGKAKMDEVYQRQNSKDAYAIGKEIFERRTRQITGQGVRPVISIIMPGEWFSRDVMVSWTGLLTGLMNSGWIVLPVFGSCTNVYVARQVLANSVVRDSPVAPHFVLTIDDDNPLSPEQFNQLMTDLKDNPDLDGVGGWSWCQKDLDGKRWMISCGVFNEDKSSKAFTYRELMEGPPLKALGWSGFPVFLFRYEAFVKAVSEPGYTPRMDPSSLWGFRGEDESFFWQAAQKGLKFAVDSRVQVRHQKLIDAGPSPEQIHALQSDSELAPVTGREKVAQWQ
jgi:hypothetical protein